MGSRLAGSNPVRSRCQPGPVTRFKQSLLRAFADCLQQFAPWKPDSGHSSVCVIWKVNKNSLTLPSISSVKNRPIVWPNTLAASDLPGRMSSTVQPELPCLSAKVGTTTSVIFADGGMIVGGIGESDRKSTRLNSSHLGISY